MADEIPVTDIERLQQRKAEALQQLDFLGRVLSLMMRLAAPRVLARVPRGNLREGREQALQHLDEYLAFFEQKEKWPDNQGQFARSEESTRRVRTHLDAWSFSGPPPAELIQAARDFHAAFYGIDGPPGGWDVYDGPEEEPL